MKKNLDVVKLVGVAATALGIASTLLSGWANERNTENLISEKVNEAIKAMTENNDI